MTTAMYSTVHSAQLELSGRRLAVVSPARLYVCGITPYDITHLGQAATFVWADTVRSVLRLAGVETLICRNLTDVDDVLTKAADQHGRPYDEFALYQEYLFEKDMAALGVHSPAFEPRARHFVTQVQQLAAALITSGHAYRRGGYIYFRGADLPARAGLTWPQALALAREFGDDPDDPRRDDPFDVPIWRPSTRDEPAWPSPWGPGRPGWHAECAAMAHSVLGTGIDILAGGADLRFPHHTYQQAIVEAATSVTPFARAHVRIGTVHRNGAKMAKSTGNLVLVADLLREYPPAAVRLLILNRVWHQPWEYRPADLDTAADTLDRLHAAATRPGGTAAVEAVTDALLNDLDVPSAVAIAGAEGGDAARLLLHVLALA